MIPTPNTWYKWSREGGFRKEKWLVKPWRHSWARSKLFARQQGKKGFGGLCKSSTPVTKQGKNTTRPVVPRLHRVPAVLQHSSFPWPFHSLSWKSRAVKIPSVVTRDCSSQRWDPDLVHLGCYSKIWKDVWLTIKIYFTQLERLRCYQAWAQMRTLSPFIETIHCVLTWWERTANSLESCMRTPLIQLQTLMTSSPPKAESPSAISIGVRIPTYDFWVHPNSLPNCVD